MADFPHARRTEVDVPGSGQDTEGDEAVGPVPLPVPSTSGTAARAAATLALEEAIMFRGSAPPSPPRPPKLVPKDQPTPPKASLDDPLTPKTMELLRDNTGDHARWFVQYIWGFVHGSVLHCRTQCAPPRHMATRRSDMPIPFSVTQRGAGRIDLGYTESRITYPC